MAFKGFKCRDEIEFFGDLGYSKLISRGFARRGTERFLNYDVPMRRGLDTFDWRTHESFICLFVLLFHFGRTIHLLSIPLLRMHKELLLLVTIHRHITHTHLAHALV